MSFKLLLVSFKLLLVSFKLLLVSLQQILVNWSVTHEFELVNKIQKSPRSL
ncbi:hypothetical protein [Peribacillus simplex]|uniref:hypothetical protein n=1 Tax=Peribacillus simplex TaxID=1478 RepID=UPI001595E920|nr:hypothetical protein [Peribacillus simplex]